MSWLSPRWLKVLRDLWSNKTRTVLVLLSIGVGVSAIGMVMGAQNIIDRNLPAAYAAVNPASGRIFTINSFDDKMVAAIESMAEVAQAEARRSVIVRFHPPGSTEWNTLQLIAISDFKDIRINKLKPQEGEFPPPEHEMLVERASFSPSLGLGDVSIGDTLNVETPSGKKRALRIAGSVHDMAQAPTFVTGSGYAYIDFDTLAWLGEPRDYNQLMFVVAENKLDIDHVTAVGKLIEKRMESAGVNVVFTLIFQPGEHPAQNFLDAFSLVLGGIGVLALGLSAFLIVNTLSAILTQHVRQIGIMKSIGARAGQISTMYLVMSLLFGILALLIAIPLGGIGAAGLASIFSGLLNFDIEGLRPQGRVVIVQTIIALSAPVLAAAWPISRGVRVTVREAISDIGLGKGQFGHSLLDRVLVRMRRVVPMGRPMQISIRNTFRRKARLATTLFTLSLASMIVISIFSIRASLQQTLDDALNFYDFDVQINFERSYRTDRIVDEIAHVPGVDTVETWGGNTARRIRPDNSESDFISVNALPPDSTMVHPTLVEGRWLEDTDANAVVVNTDVLKDEEDVTVGSTITLSINGKESDWVVVGIVRGLLTGANIFVDL